jgi:methionyl-tRNA formyltransferase
MNFLNILVISDNSYLAEKLNLLITKHKIQGQKFVFAISPFSNPADFEIKSRVYDLKERNHIEEIIANYELVFSLHCKQLFPSELVRKVKCINIHPGYNPLNRGWYPQVFSIIYDLPIGATIHEMDGEVDHGSIIARKIVKKYGYDTSETLYKRVIELELELLDEYLPLILANSYEEKKPEIEGNLYLKRDFNNLKKIDLNKNYKAEEFLKLLRALTHGDFKNAYYIDKDTGRKVYISLKILVDDPF